MSPKQIIFKLETKVEAAIELIRMLKQKNVQLSSEKESLQKKHKEYEETVQRQLDEYEERVLELEKLVDSAQKEQSNLEKSVVTAINSFDTIEELQSDTSLNSHTPLREELPSSTVNKDVDADTVDVSSDNIANKKLNTKPIESYEISDQDELHFDFEDDSNTDIDNISIDMDNIDHEINALSSSKPEDEENENQLDIL